MSSWQTWTDWSNIYKTTIVGYKDRNGKEVVVMSLKSDDSFDEESFAADLVDELNNSEVLGWL